MLLGSNQSLFRKLCRRIGNRRGNSGKMEPVGILKNIVKIKICLCGRGDGGMGPIVNYLGGSHG